MGEIMAMIPSKNPVLGHAHVQDNSSTRPRQRLCCATLGHCWGEPRTRTLAQGSQICVYYVGDMVQLTKSPTSFSPRTHVCRPSPASPGSGAFASIPRVRSPHQHPQDQVPSLAFPLHTSTSSPRAACPAQVPCLP